MVRLSVPGSLVYRNLAIRVVASSCKLVGCDLQGAGHAIADEFDSEVVSAFGEAFNNIAIHGYAGGPPGDIEIEIEIEVDAITIRLRDMGRTYDPFAVPPPKLERLPESGMGLYIIQSFMDRVAYSPGNPPEKANELWLYKRRICPRLIGGEQTQRGASDRS
jgi:serine/threonine-protein kinase RsbW